MLMSWMYLKATHCCYRYFQLSADGKSLEVIFSDGHRSSFCKDWLKKNAFTTERRKELRRGDKMAPVAWGKEMEGNVPELDYTKVTYNLIQKSQQWNTKVHDSSC